MEDFEFKALVVREIEKGVFHREITRRAVSDLPAGEVLIRVAFSSLNYKDALSASGNRGVTRRYPHTPGIDAAGTVLESTVPEFSAGDEVLCMGYDLGMNTPGGFGQCIRVPADWVLPCPQSLSLLDTMRIGTAGFTAAQCVHRLLEEGLQVGDGPVLVTGATGGVGSVAVSLLSRLGFEVTAVTGKESAHTFLHDLGAHTIIDRRRATGNPDRMMLRERWAGVVDTVGGPLLATALKSTRYRGIVTCCGNVASGDLPINVYPFILRAVTLAGIDSAKCSMARRKEVWQLLAGEWRLDLPAFVSRIISPEALDKTIDAMLQGQVQGRIVVNMQEDV